MGLPTTTEKRVGVSADYCRLQPETKEKTKRKRGILETNRKRSQKTKIKNVFCSVCPPSEMTRLKQMSNLGGLGRVQGQRFRP